jgi:hypothetical protein
MQFETEVGAAVLDYDEAVIGISGLEEGGENDAAGGDAEEDNGSLSRGFDCESQAYRLSNSHERG